MAARTSLVWMLGVVLIAAQARGDDDGQGWRIEEWRVRFSYFSQHGHGLQSLAGPGLAGSERLRVYEPMAYIRARQNERVEHTLIAPVDIITSASTDAIDAVTSASRVNEAGTLDLRTRVAITQNDTLTFRYGGHVEEWFRSVFAGVGYERELAQDNATVAVTINGTADFFRPYGPTGDIIPPGNDVDIRGAFNVNADFSQILSPTTLAALSYGLTWQRGVLAQPWHTVPHGCNAALTMCESRERELFPSSRLRHALSGLLVQHIPKTHSTLRLGYRFYSDDFDVVAHTPTIEFYQYVTSRAYVRTHYRAHRQSAVSFWSENLPAGSLDDTAPRTADSDLGAFWSHEWGGKILIFVTPRGGARERQLDVSYLRYRRSNGLRVDLVTTGYGQIF